MAYLNKFSYQRLKPTEGWFKDEEEMSGFRARNFARIRKFNIRRRLKIRIPGLRMVLRKRVRFLRRVRASCRKALKRLKNGQAHMNDLFGGNFLIWQVTPTPFRFGERPLAGHHIHGLPPKARKIKA